MLNKGRRTHLIGLVTLIVALFASSVPVAGSGIPDDITGSEDPRLELHRQKALEARRMWESLQPTTVVLLQNVSHEYQGWNNCGPTSLGIELRYFGLNLWQKDTAPVLKPNPNDKNVRPDEMAAFARSKGLKALTRVNGDFGLLKQFVKQGIPVILQIWYLPEDNGGFGHYRVLKGYDDNRKQFIFADTFLGPTVYDPYDTLRDQWRVYNNTYIVIYRPEQEADVQRILGANLDEDTMYRSALLRARIDLEKYNDAFAWFTLGTAQESLGDHANAAASFDKARAIGLPPRMMWYQFGAFESYLAVKRYDDAIKLADAVLAGTPHLEEPHYYKAKALEAAGRKDEARREYQLALSFNPNYGAANQSLKALAAVTAAPAANAKP